MIISETIDWKASERRRMLCPSIAPEAAAMIPVLFALAAGMLTTITGVGGGAVLMLGLAVVWDPMTALAVTAPALGIGNLHRWWLFRRETDFALFGAFIAGALPGSLLGGLVVTRLPQGVLFGIMAGMALLGAARALGWFQWRPKARFITPAGLGVGVVAAGAGGAGLLTAPLMLAAGLSGGAYLATAAGCAFTMHAGRLTAYAVEGLIGPSTLGWSLVLAVAVTSGNLIGKKVRTGMSDALTRRVEVGAMLMAVALAITGVTR